MTTTPPRRDRRNQGANPLDSPRRDRRDQGANPLLKDRPPLQLVSDLNCNCCWTAFRPLFLSLRNYLGGETPTFIRWYTKEFIGYHGAITHIHIIIAYDQGYNRMFRASWNGFTLHELLDDEHIQFQW